MTTTPTATVTQRKRTDRTAHQVQTVSAAEKARALADVIRILDRYNLMPSLQTEREA